MTCVPSPAGGSVPPNKQKGQPLPAVWAQGDTRVHITPLAEARPCPLAAPGEKREGTAGDCHSPCKASLALASSCSFWASCTLSSVAERTSEDLPPCDSSRSFVNISFICRRRWTSSWSRDTSSRRSTRGEGHRVRGRGCWLTRALFLGTVGRCFGFSCLLCLQGLCYTCEKKQKKPKATTLFQRAPDLVLGPCPACRACLVGPPHPTIFSRVLLAAVTAPRATTPMTDSLLPSKGKEGERMKRWWEPAASPGKLYALSH